MEDLLDFHIYVNAGPSSSEQIADIRQSVAVIGEVHTTRRHMYHTILRVKAPSETYLFLRLKFGSDNVWLR